MIAEIYNPLNNKNIQPVNEYSKFRTVDLGKTELGALRTCARVPRARARVARAKQIHQHSPLFVRVLLLLRGAFFCITYRGKLLLSS
jgi:hypothetical protein